MKAIARVPGLSLDDFDDTGKKEIKPTYNDVTTIYTRSKNNLSQKKKMSFARIISSDDGE